MAILLESLIALFSIALVFGIPLAFSPIGKAWAERIRAGSVPGDLERRIRDLEHEVHQLREIVVLGEGARRPELGRSTAEPQPGRVPPGHEHE